MAQVGIAGWPQKWRQDLPVPIVGCNDQVASMAEGVCVCITTRFPAAVDTIVIGAGTAGAAVVGRLAAGSSERMLLLEAGPDYGPADSGRWPRDLLDATSVAWSHDWGYTGEFGGQVIHFSRARVVGGCSSHNAGAVVFGSRFDYDGWAAAGNLGWSARELLPLFASAWKTAAGKVRRSQ